MASDDDGRLRGDSETPRRQALGLRNALALLCLFIAGLADGTRDSLQFHFDRTAFANAAVYDAKYWNPAISWKNKYLNGNPANGERFPLSSTALVFATDAWHLLKFVMINSFLLAALLCQLPLDEPGRRLSGKHLLVGLIVLHGIFSAGFALAYR